MKTTKKNLDQTVIEKGGNAHVEININNGNGNETKKRGGFKRGALVGTVGGVFLGGVGTAYAIENGITMEDVKQGANEIIDGINRGVNAAFNNEQPASQEGETPANDEPIVTPIDETTEGNPTTLTTDETIDAIQNAISNNAEEPEVTAIAEEPLTHDEVIDAISNAIDENGNAALTVSETNYDEMSFNEAFAAARAEAGGPGGVFEWRGGLYGTFLADEWNSLSDDEKADYGSDVTEILEDYEFRPEIEAMGTGMEDTETHKVEVVNTWTITDASGEKASVAHLTVDGQDVALIDKDGNGSADTMVRDANQDGIITEDEVVNIENENIEMEEINNLYNNAEDDTNTMDDTDTMDCDGDIM